MTDHTRIDALSPGTFALDGDEVEFGPGESILQAATRAGHYIPHLCWHPDFGAKGSCRLCTVRINGRMGAACTVQAASGQEVESNTDDLNAQRKTLLQMMFIEGNHFCPSCERSGNCRLQATAYDMGVLTPAGGDVGASNSGTTVGLADNDASSSATGPDVYYQFTLTAPRTVDISVTASGFDTLLGLSGGSPAIAPIAVNAAALGVAERIVSVRPCLKAAVEADS